MDTADDQLAQIAGHLQALERLQKLETDVLAAMGKCMAEIAALPPPVVAVADGVKLQPQAKAEVQLQTLSQAQAAAPLKPQVVAKRRRAASDVIVSSGRKKRSLQPQQQQQPIKNQPQQRKPGESLRSFTTRVLETSHDLKSVLAALSAEKPPAGDVAASLLAFLQEQDLSGLLSPNGTSGKIATGVLQKCGGSRKVVAAMQRRVQEEVSRLLSAEGEGVWERSKRAGRVGLVLGRCCGFAGDFATAELFALDTACGLAGVAREADKEGGQSLGPPSTSPLFARCVVLLAALLGAVRADPFHVDDSQTPRIVPATRLWAVAAANVVAELRGTLQAEEVEEGERELHRHALRLIGQLQGYFGGGGGSTTMLEELEAAASRRDGKDTDAVAVHCIYAARLGAEHVLHVLSTRTDAAAAAMLLPYAAVDGSAPKQTQDQVKDLASSLLQAAVHPHRLPILHAACISSGFAGPLRDAVLQEYASSSPAGCPPWLRRAAIKVEGTELAVKA